VVVEVTEPYMVASKCEFEHISGAVRQGLVEAKAAAFDAKNVTSRLAFVEEKLACRKGAYFAPWLVWIQRRGFCCLGGLRGGFCGTQINDMKHGSYSTLANGPCKLCGVLATFKAILVGNGIFGWTKQQFSIGEIDLSPDNQWVRRSMGPGASM